jgi:hypothetical protein
MSPTGLTGLERLKDKSWRMTHLYSIIDRNKKKVVFKPNRAQEDFEKNRHCRNIILKSRRLGFTTYEAIDSLDDTLFTRNFSSLFIAHTKDDAIEIFNTKIDFTWKNFNQELASLWKVDASTANKLKFDFGNNNFSQMIVSNSGRSGTHNRVHISEFGKLCARYAQKAGEVISGTIPSVPPEGRIDIESTAEGMSGDFYEMFNEAWKRRREPLQTEFKAHFYNWQWDDEEIAKIESVIPTSQMDDGYRFKEYQELHHLTDREITYYYTKWLSLKKDWDMLHQEFPTTPEEAFVASGNTFFNKERLVSQMAIAPEPIKIEQGVLPDSLYNHYLEGNLKIYELPQDFTMYVIAADVAEGKGGDSSCANGISNKTLLPAFGFNSNKIRPDDYAELLDTIGRWYNNAYLAVESNTGLWVLTELNETYKYPNLYWQEQVDTVTHAVNKKLGYNTGTGKQGRKVMLDNLLVEVNTQEGIWTKDFLVECLTFIRNDLGRPEAAEGKHDDEVISVGICHYVRDNAPAEIKHISTEPQTVEQRIMARLQKKKEAREGTQSISQSNYL